MGMLCDCSNCGHTQMVGHNPVDGRLQWWTECEKCKTGNFMSPPDPRFIDALVRAFGKAASS